MDMDTIKFSLNKDNEIVVSASQDVETKYIEKVICKNEKPYIKPIDKVLYLSSILEVSKTFDYKIDIWDNDTFLLRSFIDVKNDNNENVKREINLTYIIGCKVK